MWCIEKHGMFVDIKNSKMEKVTLTVNKKVLPELLSQLEKINGFLIAHIKDKNERYEEFPLLYQLIQQLKEERDKIEF